MKDSNTLKKYVMDPVWNISWTLYDLYEENNISFKAANSVLCTERIECTNTPYT